MRDNIPGFPGYHITKHGDLYSMLRGNWVKRKPNIVRGRAQYVLFRNGKRIIQKTSRLVATVYIPNPQNYPVVMHIDNNPENNFYKNLMWGTYSMNTQQAVREGRFPQCKRFGKDNPMYGKKPWNTGKAWSDEVKVKISKANKGKIMPEEAKAKISKTLRLNSTSKITLRKQRRILRLKDMGKSQQYIANRVGLHQTTISGFLRGRIKPKRN